MYRCSFRNGYGYKNERSGYCLSIEPASDFRGLMIAGFRRIGQGNRLRMVTRQYRYRFNGLDQYSCLLFMFPKTIRTLRDYEKQKRQGIDEPVFDPQKMDIGNAE